MPFYIILLYLKQNSFLTKKIKILSILYICL
nr:MAG TPA: hypothetical protein [Bacteriophage sp.]